MTQILSEPENSALRDTRYDDSSPGNGDELYFHKLEQGSRTWPDVALSTRVSLLKEIRRRLRTHADEWIQLCTEAKSCVTSGQVSEDILSGPGSVARYLTLLIDSLSAIDKTGTPNLPGNIQTLPDGRLSVPVFPARGIWDELLFLGMRGRVWMEPGVSEDEIHGVLLNDLTQPPAPAPIALVLGAGNVSAIPITDTLAKLFQSGHVALLKLNPVNEYLHEVFEKILAPVIEPGWLKIVKGDARVGQALVDSEQTDSVHITGSQRSHDVIVWGDDGSPEAIAARVDPKLKKTITSELGNVSPWMVVPGEYTARQLRMQAQNVAASLTNNCAFNCITTRVLITSRNWSQRDEFLELLQDALASIPARVPYYPGSVERYEYFTGEEPTFNEDGTLAWHFRPDVDPTTVPRLLDEESFLPISIEVCLEAESDRDFLDQAVTFCNDRLYGTLSAAITIPTKFRKKESLFLTDQISRLDYGTIGINQWPAIVYGLMTPPWGGAPGADLTDVKSGIGDVHNLFFLDRYQKTVLTGPLCNFPVPPWFASHRSAEAVARKLLDYYCEPSSWKIPGIAVSALSH